MPSKVEANLESAPQINVVSTPKNSDTSLTDNFLIKGVEAAGEAIGQAFTRKTLSNAQSQIDEAAAGAVAAGQQASQQKEALLQQMMSADESIAAKAKSELDELRLAKDQGLMSGSEREIRVNSLVKWYANQYPHLAGQIRTMGSQANENIAGAVRATAGQDPVEKGRNALIEEATQRGVPPAQIIKEKNLEKQYQLAEQAGKALAYSRDATKETLFINLQNEQQAYMTNRSVGIMRELTLVTKANKGVHNDQILALLEQARTQDLLSFSRKKNEYQTASGVALSVDQGNSLESDINAVYDSLKVQIGALKTPEQLAKWSQANVDLLLTHGREKFMKAAGGNFQAVLAAQSPEAFNDFVQAGIQTQIVRQRMYVANGKNQTKADEEFYTLFKTDPQAMSMLRLAQDGSLDDLMAAAVGGAWDNGAEIATNNAVVNHKAKEITLNMYDTLPWGRRQPRTENLVNSMNYNEIKQSKLLMSDIKYSQTATNKFLEKSTLQAMDDLGEKGTRTEMQINYGNYNNPITPKWGSNSAKVNAQTVNVNNIFRTIRDNLGPQAAQDWLDTLSTLGVTSVDKTNGSTLDRKQQSSGPDNRRQAFGPSERQSLRDAARTRTDNPIEAGDSAGLSSYTLEKADELGVPRPLVKAFLQVESGGGKNLVGPTTGSGARASGPLMVMPATFEAINDKYFGGELRFAEQKDKALAGLALLAELVQKYGDDIESIAGEYHGGPDWKPTRTDGVTTTGDYIEKIKTLVDRYSSSD